MGKRKSKQSHYTERDPEYYDSYQYYKDEPHEKTGYEYLNVKTLKYKTNAQKIAHDIIKENTVTFLGGPAGTGKSFLPCAEGIALLKKQVVKRIVISRPMVEAGEKMGHLPGDANQKIHPYLLPLLDNLEALVGEEELKKLLEEKKIVFEPINFLRGRTLQDSFIIIDEAQNCTKREMKLILTRFGDNAKAVVTFDESQIDIKEDKSCVEHLPYLFNARGVGHYIFKESDIMRSEITAAFIAVYKEIGF